MFPLPVAPLPRKRESGERTFLARGPGLQETAPRLQHAGACLSLSPRATGRCAGMTLLELVIAIAIFSLVAAAAYAALSQGLVVQDRLQEQRRFWQRFETVFNLVHTDLDQAVGPAPSDPGQAVGPAPSGVGRDRFEGYAHGNSAAYAHILEFTRRVNTDFHAGPASPFLRVGYRLDDGGLYRRTWAPLDQPYASEAAESLLLEGISDIRLRYYLADTVWLTRWPQLPLAGNDPIPLTGNDQLPRALEMTIELEDGSDYRWLFHVGPPR